jgi:hypothetical protein
MNAVRSGRNRILTPEHLIESLQLPVRIMRGRACCFTYADMIEMVMRGRDCCFTSTDMINMIESHEQSAPLVNTIPFYYALPNQKYCPANNAFLPETIEQKSTAIIPTFTGSCQLLLAGQHRRRGRQTTRHHHCLSIPGDRYERVSL